MTRPLTNQQQIVYDFIRDKIVSRGYGPTVREIGEHMNIKSPNGVMCHLRALERKGMITRTANKSRAIELTESISRLVGANLALGGTVSGGACMIDPESKTQIDLAQLCTPDRFALQVRDDSLKDAQIMGGDLLIAQRQLTALNGQLALVRTGDSETCLRFWLLDGSRIRLQPANRAMPPKIVEHAEVLAVVVSVLRNMLPPDLGTMPP